VATLTVQCQPSIKVGGKDILHRKKAIQSIQDLCNNFNLVDAWRFQHPDEASFSWSNSLGKIKCRLDFWLILKQLLCRVIKIGINGHYDSNHCPVAISIGSEEKKGQRGPGFRKFNKSLLENEEFVFKMKFIIINAKEKYKDVTDARKKKNKNNNLILSTYSKRN